MKCSRVLFAMIFGFSIASCGGDGGGGGGGGNGNGGGEITPSPSPVPSEVNCDTPVSFYVQNTNINFPDYLPSWEQLDCYVDSMARLPRSSFTIQVGDTPPSEDGPASTLSFWEIHQNLINGFVSDWPQADLFGFVFSEVPPYLMGDGQGYTDVQWDQKLRGMATYGMYLKNLGYPVEVNFFYPPSLFDGSEVIPVVNSAEEFLAWWNNSYIPQRVEIAQVAELIKAEYYQPWDVEPGVFVRSMGGDWLELLSDEEQVSLAQTAIDNLHDAVRAEYSGMLTLINYDRYAAFGEHWKNINLSDWDEVQFILFTEGNVEATQAYLQDQISTNVEMVLRDNIQGHICFDVAVNRSSHERLLNESDPSYDEIEVDIYQAFFDAIDNLQIQVDCLGIEAGSIETTAARTLVTEQLNSYLP